MRCFLFVALALLTASPAPAQPPDPNELPESKELGRYADTLSQICGAKKIDVHPASIPEIGCFAIKAGSSLDGIVDGRRVSIRLAANSFETYFVEGVEIRIAGLGTTNDPRVKPGSSGYVFCRNAAGADCPSTINVMVRRAGWFATFDVARQIRPRVYVGSEENWKAETKR